MLTDLVFCQIEKLVLSVLVPIVNDKDVTVTFIFQIPDPNDSVVSFYALDLHIVVGNFAARFNPYEQVDRLIINARQIDIQSKSEKLPGNDKLAAFSTAHSFIHELSCLDVSYAVRSRLD